MTSSCAGPQRVEPTTNPATGADHRPTTHAAMGKTAASVETKPGGARPAALSFTLSEMTERTGDELGLAVPMLLLTLKNGGREAIEVPQPGIDLIISLRLSITAVAKGGKPQQRYATLLRTWTVQLAPFSPGEPIRQPLSPLSLKRDDVPLQPGRYRVAVCVPPSSEAPYPSRFTDVYGGICSNEVEIESKKRR